MKNSKIVEIKIIDSCGNGISGNGISGNGISGNGLSGNGISGNGADFNYIQSQIEFKNMINRIK